jgi:predicted nucleic acid-binding protein
VSVVDASLLIDVLVGLPAGRPWRRWVAADEGLAAPDCFGVELSRYLRRHMLRGVLAASDADRCLDVFDRLAWRLGEPLATTNSRLARAAEALGVEAVPEPGGR